MDGEVCTTCGAPTADGHSHDAPAEGGADAPAEAQNAPAPAESAPAPAEAKPWWKFW